MNNKVYEIEKLIEKYKQEHLLRFFTMLSKEEQNELINEIQNIDFELMQKLYIKLVKDKKNEIRAIGKIAPLESVDFDSLDDDIKKRFYERGMDYIKKRKIAILLVAGGQGTRLGHFGPKGTFDIGLPSKKSLFQLQCEKIFNLSKKAGENIPWYIMTSHDNHKETLQFFIEHNNFGYSNKHIFFFEQDTLPMVDKEGKVNYYRLKAVALQFGCKPTKAHHQP